RLAARPVGLRQDDADAPHRRPDRADHRHHRRRRQDAQAGAGGPRVRLRLPGAGPLRVAHGPRERDAAARDHGLRQGPPPRAGARAPEAGRPRALRALLPVAALGRHAAARLDRPRARLRPQAPADGRAVRGPRRDHPRGDEPRAPAPVAGDEEDRRVRDALDRGGRLPLHAHRGDDCAPGADQGGHRGRPALPAHARDARDAALLRAHHAGARGSARRRARTRGAPSGGTEDGGLLSMPSLASWVRRFGPVVAVVAVLLALMYPVALLLGLPIARERMGNVSNWLRGSAAALPVADASASGQRLPFGGDPEVDERLAVLSRGTPVLVMDGRVIEAGVTIEGGEA